MNKLENLKEELRNQESVKRFKELESILDQDAKLRQDYEHLKNLQKRMVQAQAKESSNLKQATKEYNEQLEKVNQHVLLSEYVDLVQSVNEDLQLIQSIISQEINMDID